MRVRASSRDVETHVRGDELREQTPPPGVFYFLRSETYLRLR